MLILSILTQHAYRGNEKLQCIILHQITVRISVTYFDLFGDISFHFNDARWSNVVLAHQKPTKYMQMLLLQSKIMAGFLFM